VGRGPCEAEVPGVEAELELPAAVFAMLPETVPVVELELPAAVFAMLPETVLVVEVDPVEAAVELIVDVAVANTIWGA